MASGSADARLQQRETFLRDNFQALTLATDPRGVFLAPLPASLACLIKYGPRCVQVATRVEEGRGTCLYATREFSPGEVVLSSDPLARSACLPVTAIAIPEECTLS
jgi:hypothetical protein